jgi:glucose/arabinose dehydrogenase
MKTHGLSITALSSAALLALASCGGGGGDAGTNPGNDTTAPVATLTAPAAAAAGLAGTITLSASATDNIAVSGIEFQVDGQQVGAIGTGGTHSVQLDTTIYASGQHVVRTRARDAAGNLSAWASVTVQFGGSRTQPAGFTRNGSWITGLTNATAFAQAPDGRFFVAEQGGTLRVVKNGVLLTAPFITLPLVDSSGERGLIGVTLDPNFANNGYVYVYYTTTESVVHNRISRFTAIPPNSDTVSANSESRIADLPMLGATNHNGGALHFGSDGKLYVGVGDNAVGANAQDLNTPFGKILRLNVDNPLSIPGDNPFCNTPNTLKCAVWAYGLRNPYTFAVQPGTGRIHINDVGEGTWEEIDVGTAGANYGWPSTEGPTTAAGVTAPLFAYKHSATVPPGTGPGGFFTGCAITGGTFYPDSGAFPAAYRGSYFFADFCSKWIGRVDLANGDAAYTFGAVGGSPVDMLVGIDGALYVLQQTGITRFSAP